MENQTHPYDCRCPEKCKGERILELSKLNQRPPAPENRRLFISVWHLTPDMAERVERIKRQTREASDRLRNNLPGDPEPDRIA
jgi:hypothetical protein